MIYNLNQPTNRWGVRLKPNPNARLRLFCFPFSGAGAPAFNTWHTAFPQEIELVAVEYPGHGQRLAEPLLRDLDTLVSAAVQGLGPYLDLPFVFFGHSLGALLAFELARALRTRLGLLPAALILSSHSAPQVEPREEKFASLPNDELVERIRRLNGTDDHVLDHPELRELFLPIFRADFAICDEYSFRVEEPLDCPIFACGGLNDIYVPPDDLAQWRSHTSSFFECRLFPGDHFYLHTSRLALVNYIAHQALALPTPSIPETVWNFL
jgi:medium-chain acyl-[acyl-carrier-protein] hydrolase